eukprot:gene25439-biopygen7492
MPSQGTGGGNHLQRLSGFHRTRGRAAQEPWSALFPLWSQTPARRVWCIPSFGATWTPNSCAPVQRCITQRPLLTDGARPAQTRFPKHRMGGNGAARAPAPRSPPPARLEPGADGWSGSGGRQRGATHARARARALTHRRDVAKGV